VSFGIQPVATHVLQLSIATTVMKFVSPHRPYGQYRQTNGLTDRYKYNKTNTMKTKLKEKIKTRI